MCNISNWFRIAKNKRNTTTRKNHRKKIDKNAMFDGWEKWSGPIMQWRVSNDVTLISSTFIQDFFLSFQEDEISSQMT